MSQTDVSEMDTSATDAEIASTAASSDTGTADVQAELEDTRKALRKANREAAERRKLIEKYENEAEERRQAEMSEQEKLTAKLSEMEERAKEAEARLDLLHKQQQFYVAVADKELQFASEQARQDAAMLVDLSEMDDADIAGLVDELQTERPYLFVTEAARKLPDVDGEKRGVSKAKGREADIQEAARRFGVTYVPLQK